MLDSFRKLLDAPTVSSSTAGTSGSGAAPPFADGSELNSSFTAGAVQQAIGRKEDYMYALAKPHGPCRGSSGSDMHKQIKNQNRDIKHPTA